MKRILTILLSLGPLFAVAQEPYIIGGYLLDGKDRQQDHLKRDPSRNKREDALPSRLKIVYSRDFYVIL